LSDLPMVNTRPRALGHRNLQTVAALLRPTADWVKRSGGWEVPGGPRPEEPPGRARRAISSERTR
jgi:hypothetical protein